MPRIIVEETESGSHFNIDISGRLDHITVHDLVEQLRINAAILPNDIDRYYLCFQDEEHKYRPYRDEGTLQENGISEGLTVYLRKGDNQKLVGNVPPRRLLGE